MGGYNYEPSQGRNYVPAEPEWFTEGPMSQSDTIELCGFDGAHGESSRTRNTSGSDASRDDGQLDGQRTKADRRSRDDKGGKHGSIKNKESSSGKNRDVNEASHTMSNAVFDDEHRQENDRGVYETFFSLSLILNCSRYRAFQRHFCT